jgi:hypothetical protein
LFGECVSRLPNGRWITLGWRAPTRNRDNLRRRESSPRTNPHLTIENGRRRRAYKDPKDSEHLFDGMRKAGLPEACGSVTFDDASLRARAIAPHRSRHVGRSRVVDLMLATRHSAERRLRSLSEQIGCIIVAYLWSHPPTRADAFYCSTWTTNGCRPTATASLTGWRSRRRPPLT